MDYRILGPLALVQDERDLAPAGAKQQALLGIFLLHPGETLSRDRLIDELWGARPPETAGNTLQVYVSQLRKLLPSGALVTRLPGYALEVDPDALDANRFERLARGGRDALARGDSAEASTALERALALWRGPVLAGVAFEGAAAGEAARLEELRISAAEDRIDAELELGRHAEVVGELEALVAEHPLRERLRGQLMVALYRAGARPRRSRPSSARGPSSSTSSGSSPARSFRSCSASCSSRIRRSRPRRRARRCRPTSCARWSPCSPRC